MTVQLVRPEVSLFNVAVTADTDILGALISPSQRSVYRIAVAVTFAAGAPPIFRVRVTDELDSFLLDFNDGSGIFADRVYHFSLGVRPELKYEFQFSRDTTMVILQVEEISGGVL